MSHFAEIDENNIVIRVLVGDDSLPNEGHDWFVENLGGRWVQTSYNGKIRKNFAGTDFVYDEERDAFIAPKPFASWILNEDTCRWEAPIAEPENPFSYYWDEESLSWVLRDFSDTPSEITE
jgi:hypothetical protein